MVYHPAIIVVVRTKLRERVKIKLRAITLDSITNFRLVRKYTIVDWRGKATPSIDVKTVIIKWKVIVQSWWSSGTTQPANNVAGYLKEKEYWTPIVNRKPWKRKGGTRSNYKLACSRSTVITRQHKLLGHSAGRKRTAYIKASLKIWKDVINRKTIVLNQNTRNTGSDGRGIKVEANHDQWSAKQCLSI